MFQSTCKMLKDLLLIFGLLNLGARALNGRNWCESSLVFSSRAKAANVILHDCPEGGTLEIYDFNKGLLEILNTKLLKPAAHINTFGERKVSRLFNTQLRISRTTWIAPNGILGYAKYKKNGVLLSEAQLKLNPRWIQNSLPHIGELTLQQLTLPGTADTGLNPIELQRSLTRSKYQENIFLQLNMGARVLYVNLCLNKANWFVCDKDNEKNVLPFSTEMILDSGKKILHLNPNELIIYVFDIAYDSDSVNLEEIESQRLNITNAAIHYFNKSMVKVIASKVDAKQTLNKVLNKGNRVLLAFSESWSKNLNKKNAGHKGSIRIIKGSGTPNALVDKVTHTPVSFNSDLMILNIMGMSNTGDAPAVEDNYKEENSLEFSVRLKQSSVEFITSQNLFVVEDFGSTESVEFSINANKRKFQLKKQYQIASGPREEAAYSPFDRIVHKYEYHMRTESWIESSANQHEVVVNRCGNLTLVRTNNSLPAIDLKPWTDSERKKFFEKLIVHNESVISVLRSNWMSQYLDFISNVSVFDLCIPATHYSGLYPKGKQYSSLAHRQSENIMKQLSMGIRGFEFAVQAIAKFSGIEFWIHNLKEPVQRLEPILQDMVKFLDLFMDEMIFIEFGDLSSFSSKAYQEFHKLLQNTFGEGSILFKSQSHPGITFGELRARSCRVVITSYGMHEYLPQIYFSGVARLLNEKDGTFNLDIRLPQNETRFVGFHPQTNAYPANIQNFDKKYPGGFQNASLQQNFELACEFNKRFEVKGNYLKSARIMYVDFFENSNIVDACITNHVLARNVPALFHDSLADH